MSEFADPNAPKKKVIPIFAAKAVKMEFKSTQAGRPIFEDQEFVTILIPGDRNTKVEELVTDEHKGRWPAEYEAFKAGREAPLDGTPLSEWPHSSMTPARIAELAFFNIRTIEHMAAVSDAHLQNLGMGARELRATAQKFLEVARTGTGPLERLINENHRLRDENERLVRDLGVANAAIAAQQKDVTHAGA